MITERTCQILDSACRPEVDTSKQTGLLRKSAAVAIGRIRFALRKYARLLVATMLRYLGAFRLERLILSRSSRFILAFHRVLPDDEINRLLDPQMYLTVRVFRQLLVFLRSHYDVVHLEELLTWDKFTKGRRKPACALTFDDGYMDNYTNAFPILKEMEMPATVFLTAALVGTSRLLWNDAVSIAFARMSGDPEARAYLHQLLCAFGVSVSIPSDLSGVRYYLTLRSIVEQVKTWPHAKISNLLSKMEPCAAGDWAKSASFRLLSWDQVREMSREGIVFGAHTLSHYILTVEDKTTAQKEIQDSKSLIESKLGKPTDTMAFPNGSYNDEVVRMARQAGFRIAVTLEKKYISARCDRMRIGRFIANQQDLALPTGHFSASLFEYEKSLLVRFAKRVLHRRRRRRNETKR